METSGIRRIADGVSKYDKITAEIKKQVIGQDRVIDEVMNVISSNEIFAKRDRKKGPKGIFLFAGPPGVGKTYLARTCANELGYKSLLLNMSAYCGDEEGKSALFGMDATFKGAKEGILLEFVEKHNKENKNPARKPNPCIVILDEFEKASRSVVLQFLQILETGETENIYAMGVKRLPEEEREQIASEIKSRPDKTDFSNVYFIFTTNVGKELYENGKQPSSELTKDAILDVIQRDRNPVTNVPYFPPEILSRFGTGMVTVFRHLETKELLQIAEMEMKEHCNKLVNGLTITVDKQLPLLLLLREGGQMDARNMKKLAENFVEGQLIELGKHWKEEYEQVSEIVIGCNEDEKDKLNELLYNTQKEQTVILYGRDTTQIETMKWLMEALENVQVELCNEPEKVIQSVRKEKGVPIVFLLEEEEEKLFEVTEGIRRMNPRAVSYILNFRDNLTTEVWRNIAAQERVEVVSVYDSDPGEIVRVIQEKTDYLRFQNVAFQFAKSGMALKYTIIPKVSEDNILKVSLSRFEQTDNIQDIEREIFMDSARIPQVTFKAGVVGTKRKRQVADVIKYLQNPRSYIEKGLAPLKGLLLYGPDAIGMKQIAKAIANEAGTLFIEANSSDIRMGVQDANPVEVLKRYFAVAKKYAPSILFLDEIERIIVGHIGQDEQKDMLVRTLLSEMNEIYNYGSDLVLVIGAATLDLNNMEAKCIDEAVLRYFTKRLYISLPSEYDRKTFLQKTGLVKSEQELQYMVMLSKGMSSEEMLYAVERLDSKTTLIDALHWEKYGYDFDFSDKDKKVKAYYEAARLYYLYRIGWYAEKYNAKKNFAQYLPEIASIYCMMDEPKTEAIKWTGFRGEPYENYTKTSLENEIGYYLSGRFGEMLQRCGYIRFNKYPGEESMVMYSDEFRDASYCISSEGAMDLKKAYKIVCDMVCRYGMDAECICGGYEAEYDEKTGVYHNLSPVVQNRVEALLKGYMEEVKEVITEGRECIQALADKLARRPYVARDDMSEIMNSYFKEVEKNIILVKSKEKEVEKVEEIDANRVQL